MTSTMQKSSHSVSDSVAAGLPKDMRTWDHGLWWLYVLELVHATRWRCTGA